MIQIGRYQVSNKADNPGLVHICDTETGRQGNFAKSALLEKLEGFLLPSESAEPKKEPKKTSLLKKITKGSK